VNLSQEHRGELALAASAAVFGVMSLLVKLASGYYHTYFISSLRFVLGIILAVAWLKLSGRGFRVQNKRDWLLRGLFGAGAMSLYYAAISISSSGRATLIVNTYPVFVTLFGILFFRERFRLQGIAALILCVLGIVLVVNDGSPYSFLGDGLALGSSMCAGMAVNFLRRARSTENAISLYLSPCLFGLPILFLGIPSAGSFEPVGIVFVILVGVSAFLAQVIMSWGYKYVSASRGSMIFFAETLIAVGFSPLVGEVLKPLFFGGLILTIAGLIVDRVQLKMHR